MQVPDSILKPYTVCTAQKLTKASSGVLVEIFRLTCDFLLSGFYPSSLSCFSCPELLRSVFLDYWNCHLLLRFYSFMIKICKCPLGKSKVNMDLTKCFPSLKDKSLKFCLYVLLFSVLIILCFLYWFYCRF